MHYVWRIYITLEFPGSLLRGRAATQFEREAEYALEHYVTNVYNEAYANQERLDRVNEVTSKP